MLYPCMCWWVPRLVLFFATVTRVTANMDVHISVVADLDASDYKPKGSTSGSFGSPIFGFERLSRLISVVAPQSIFPAVVPNPPQQTSVVIRCLAESHAGSKKEP